MPSPDWRDQVIYFVVTDRFADGDPTNDDQGAGEFKAGDAERYNGGDLAGLTRHLDYIRGLGATALWITPPVANQWLAPGGTSAGYHGYWAENFTRIDRHLGTLDDYRRLSDALHRRGMFLVQDIVVNHTGNYFGYRGGWDAADPARHAEVYTDTPPVPRPSQPPFDLDDPRDAAQRAAAIYHWTPDIVDYNDPAQLANFQMAGLDDLNTENPVVRRALRASYDGWIREVGVDAFRVDTAFYVPPAYFDDFMHARDAAAPGVALAARRSGRRDFLVFGEGFGIDRPGDDRESRRIAAYMSDPQGRSLLPGMLNFPLYGALGDVFARGHAAAELGDRIRSMLAVFPRPHAMVNFVDNHDVERFLAGGSVAGLKQALLALMTLPGIPALYYGTEQGYTVPRAAMFAAGYASGGVDHYDRSAPLYRAIAGMTALRREQRLFSRGLPVVLGANRARSGAIAWRTDWRTSAGRESALVVFNTSDGPTLLDALPTGLAPGTLLRGLYGMGSSDGPPADVVVGRGGLLTLPLAARAALVWKVTRERHAIPAAAAALAIDALPGAVVEGDFEVAGSARGAARLQFLVDDDLGGAAAVVPGADGRWRAAVATAALGDGAAPHRVTIWAPGEGVVASREFGFQRRWQPLVDVAIPPGRDRGPGGRYRYPPGDDWAAVDPMALRRVAVAGAGGALRLDLTMAGLSRAWNPPNGFDHVAFTIYIELPDRAGGATVMPLQNADLPGGMRWHLRLRVGGWTNAIFGPEGASATNEGRPLTPGATVSVDREARRVRLELPAALLGPHLSGARILVTTWDYDGGYRALAPEPGPHTLGGGAADDPKVMGDSGVIVVP
ncbi:MAG: hypothetical protein KGN16_24700 [Burkholderiales bacterium]|nr:hypothetical protein [Burkholderiales bacterium]